MLPVIMDSFDFYASAADASEYWNSVSGAVSFSTTIKRNGRASFQSGAGGQMTKTTASYKCWHILCGLYLPALNATVLSLTDAGTLQFVLSVDAAGHLVAKRNATVLGTSTNALLAGQWYQLECKVTIDGTAGVVQIRVAGDATPWLDLSSQNTKYTANATADGFKLAAAVNIDDLIVYADATLPPTWYGECRVISRTVASDGTYSEWAPSTGTDHSACVNGATFGAAGQSISTPDNGDRDSFNLQAVAPLSGTIQAVKLLASVKKDDAGNRTLAPLLRKAGSDWQGDNFIPLNTYSVMSQILETDPISGGNFTAAGLDSTEMGVVVVA